MRMHSPRLSWFMRYGAAVLAIGLLSSPEAHAALTFNITYDSSVTGSPLAPEIEGAFQYATGFFQQYFYNPITINLNVGWGEVGGQSLGSFDLGESSSNTVTTTYAQLPPSLLLNSGLVPWVDPTGGRTITVNTADAKVLGLSGPSSSLDGSVGFDSAVTWTFDANHRAQPNAYDFIGVAEHEISEVMGRNSMLTPGCTGSSCPESVLDLFRYTAPGHHDLTGTQGDGAYFSLNGGVTSVNTYNTNAATDLADWVGQTVDAFNFSGGTGQELPVSYGDRQEMYALGYGQVFPAAPVPEPTERSLLLVGLGLIRMAWVRRASTRNREQRAMNATNQT